MRKRIRCKSVYGAVMGALLLTLLAAGYTAPALAGGRVKHIAATQLYVSRFVKTMFTYSVPGDISNFAQAGRYMTDETESKWREWYSGWLQNAGFTKSTSDIDVGQVIVNPVMGPGGEIRARMGVVTYTSILGRDFESAGTISVTLLPREGSGWGVGVVRHESDEGGVFEVSASGVTVKSAIGEQNFNKMVLDAGS